MKNLAVSVSPHIAQKSKTTRSIMLDVIIALTPALVMAADASKLDIGTGSGGA